MKCFTESLQHFFKKGIGGKIYHIISGTAGHDLPYAAGDPRITLLIAVPVAACHIAHDHHLALRRRKGGSGIHLKVPRCSSQQAFVILDRKKGRGKKHCRGKLIHTCAQMSGRIRAIQMKGEPSSGRTPCSFYGINNVMAVDPVKHLPEMTEAEVKLEKLRKPGLFTACRSAARLRLCSV